MPAWTFEPSPAIPIVQDGYAKYQEKGDQWASQAASAVNQLASFTLTPISFAPAISLTNIEQNFDRPARPDVPSVPGISTSVPDLPALAALILKTAGDAPTPINLDHLLAYHAPDQPNVSLPAVPESNIQLIDVVVADRGAIQIPVPPTLAQLGVVPFPTLNLQAFQGQRPSISIDIPTDGQLDFQETEYTPALASAIQTALGAMLQGQMGLPLAVEQAILDRGRAREDRLSRKQIVEVAEDMASRGFDEPNGVLASRMREVRADNREKGANLNRDLTIRIAEIGVERIQTGLSQGIAWEQVLISKSEAQNERALRLAIYARDYGLRRIESLVAIQNLQMQAYAIDAQVFKTLIEAELTKLEELKGRIELEKLKGVVNDGLIRQYEAQWKGVQAMADFYRTDVEAAKVKGEINVQRISAAELDVRKYVAQVEGYGKVWDAHKANVEASLAPLRAAEIASGAYAQRVAGHRSSVEAIIAENRVQLDANGQTIELGRLALSRAEQVRLAETAAVDAILRRFSGSVGLYQADGALAQAESASRDRVISLAIEQNRNAGALALQANEMAIQQMLKIGEIMERKLEALAQVLSNLTASSQSAVNLGASVSYSGSDSTSWNYQGEIN